MKHTKAIPGKWVRNMQVQMQTFNMTYTHDETDGVSLRVPPNRPLYTELDTWCCILD